MGYQILYLVLYGSAAAGAFLMHRGFIPWHGKNFRPSEEQNKSMRKNALFIALAMFALFLIKVLEILGLW